MTNDEEWARVSSGHAEALLAENDRLRAVNDELQSENTRLRRAVIDRKSLLERLVMVRWDGITFEEVESVERPGTKMRMSFTEEATNLIWQFMIGKVLESIIEPKKPK